MKMVVMVMIVRRRRRTYNIVKIKTLFVKS